MNRDILHPITEEQITEYEENGAICIRGQFDAEWCQHMLEVSENNMENRAGRQREVDNDDDPGYFYVSSYMSRQNKDFEDYILNSPSAEIAARLMRLDEVRFFYDQLFIKEPGTLAPTQWHNDIPFWPFDGNHIASVWMALTPVSMATSGLVYVKGSHKWNKLFQAITPDEDPAFIDESMERCPEFHKEFDNPDYEFLSWDMEPGDVIVHHPLAVHGTGKNGSATQRRVALSCRFYGGDATWLQERKTGFQVPGALEAGVVTSGVMPTDDAIFPVCWQAS
ncbi:MAG: phytanoyl-CoA dioxygenase family protein [Rhodospirillaceae bacterium]|jgi:ectoine hydroxylase-related dioxygenase (phytanoyl-CoA dioxygenase family)|nr:phytanoyl-CoA dioxygenase family protein [Rhodospirillaceae bacterium]MBT7953911.1 phytanoyl-CoA dioxygenase family protein [Rhodospirillaceae bacterium]